MSDADDAAEFGYTEWRCTNCGRSAPKNNPPCKRCGNMGFEQAEVRASDVDVSAASTRELLRENARSVAAGVGVLVLVAVLTLAYSGAFVLADPFGLGYRYGSVPAVTPDDDGRVTAAELHGRVAADYDDAGMRWDGRGLALSVTSSASSSDALATDLVRVAEWYADYVGSGGEAAWLRVTVEVGDGRARVTVARADAAAFAAGDLSTGAYRARVLGSGGG